MRFVRRLVAERRVRFVKLGRYVRFDPAHLDDLIAAGLVHPFPSTRRAGALAAAISSPSSGQGSASTDGVQEGGLGR